MKIKKYTIDQEIPKGAIPVGMHHLGFKNYEYHFLVEEEKTPISELSIIKGIENLEEDY